jgi:hypothetical protein
MLTVFPHGVSSFGIPVLGGAPIPFTGNYFFVDPVNGNDGNHGASADRAFQTLYKALSMCVSGNNDVVYLIGNGAATGTARLSLANAQAVDSSVSTGTLVWNKNATHLIGICAPTGVAQRARLAPPTGTYTQATFGSGNFVTVSGSGCMFANFSLFHGFSTGGVNQICWTDTGSRNFYGNVDFGGMGDAASAADAGSRSLKIGAAGSGEHTFYRCYIGLDTVTRSVANASLEFAGATPRSRFTECVFPFMTSNAGVLGILGTGNSCVDRWNLFERCLFMNAIKSTSTQMTVLGSFTTASPGGLIYLKDCAMVGATKFGDANFLANSYIDMDAVSAAAGGLGVNPS